MSIKQCFAAFLAFFAGLWGNVFTFFNNFVNDYTFRVDTAVLGETLPNVKGHLNTFSGRFPEDPPINEVYNPYEFIDYIQLMECSGGNAARDLFRDPDDFSVIDDYDFSALITSCRGVLKTGAKPLLKLGNVPSKLSRRTLAAAGTDLGDFDVNVYPPDDYNEYYNYIKALAQALVDAFSLEEVRAWRFGVLTEYENAQWFHVPGADPAQSAQAYCKLYDYTVQALIDVIGDDVFVGAHSMSCSEGLWDEREFIRHCGTGTNYATGGTGARLCYLSASYYEQKPGKSGNPVSIPEIMALLRGTAESVGLNDLLYGVDEGRVLTGNASGRNSNDLPSRTVGDTWQAAFDARLVKQMFDSGMDYFSSWEYCSQGGNVGNPLISYFVAKHAADFEGARTASVQTEKKGAILKADVNASAAFDENANTLRIMAYNYRNKVKYRSDAELTFRVNAPQFTDGEARVTMYMIDDDCNWFDEWRADRKALNITDDKFAWSPDDGCPNWVDENARQTFLQLSDKYADCCRLEPVTTTVTVKDGAFTLSAALDPFAVVFFEVTQ